MIRLVLVGAAGRMGVAVTQALAGQDSIELKARVDVRPNRTDGPGVWSSDPGSVIAAGDVVIEFSSPEGARTIAGLCAAGGAALVSGSTGLAPGDEDAIREASRTVAVVRSANFSLGVAVLRRALRSALERLPAGWDIEIVERHHRGKVDSPSGTALALAKEAMVMRGLSESSLRQGRSGRLGTRPANEIGVHAVRGGTWAGDHEVLLAGDGEWLELRHVAQDRGAFAHGAIAAARFAASAGPGLYNLEDVLKETR